MLRQIRWLQVQRDENRSSRIQQLDEETGCNIHNKYGERKAMLQLFRGTWDERL
jgi:hypothetical protein